MRGIAINGRVLEAGTDLLTTNVLCCRYLAVYFGRLTLPFHRPGRSLRRCALWAVGAQNEGKPEMIGVWFADEPGQNLWQIATANLKDRGVETVQVVVGVQLADFGLGLPTVDFGSIVVPSMQELLAICIARASPGSRGRLATALRALVTADSGEAADVALRQLEGDRLGKQCPEVMKQLRCALAQCAPFFALPIRRRRRVLSIDRTFDNLHGSLVRAMGRHGSFGSEAVAVDFIAGALLRAERRLKLARANTVAEPRLRCVTAEARSWRRPSEPADA
jgi:putative transposase